MECGCKNQNFFYKIFKKYYGKTPAQYRRDILLEKNFQDNYMGPPNLAHQRIDVDNVSGKIGQERREKEISKYQNQPSFAKDQVYNTYIILPNTYILTYKKLKTKVIPLIFLKISGTSVCNKNLVK